MNIDQSIRRWFLPMAFLLPLAIVVWGCGKDGGAKPNNENPTDGTPTYTTDIAPILEANCNCHFTGGSHYSVTPLDTYANVYARRELVKQRAGVAGTMPPTGPLPQNQRETIIAWVDGGAPE